MPTSSSSSIHLSHQSRRRSKNVPASAVGKLVPVETTCYPNNMRPREEPKKLVSNGYLAKKEKVVRYRECRKNHAANIGGFALDGCREFMASGEEGTSAALRNDSVLLELIWDLEVESESDLKHLQKAKTEIVKTRVSNLSTFECQSPTADYRPSIVDCCSKPPFLHLGISWSTT
ncbi:hypothetical protein NE237_004629 [Protea cynaroides]|uniref:ZF-HD dimerization-type domain-containing protein n=1 Tax=Protea cynaroides TaxID=273540 RepID=A0A9Q0QTI6_9MAGN|nr:hypothetical protein NE237_004629 [Protea cynaroides]